MLGDEVGTYIMAIKSIWQTSVNRIQSYDGMKGHYYYPLAFPLICGQLSRLAKNKLSFKQKSSTKLLNLLSEDEITHLDRLNFNEMHVRPNFSNRVTDNVSFHNLLIAGSTLLGLLYSTKG